MLIQLRDADMSVLLEKITRSGYKKEANNIVEI